MAHNNDNTLNEGPEGGDTSMKMMAIYFARLMTDRESDAGDEIHLDYEIVKDSNLA